ncbi:MAG: alanine--tRNA ligase [Anaerolineales bacterium]|nr:MAG: alanine--tRNA ligase [Anaerolineales bacterium]
MASKKVTKGKTSSWTSAEIRQSFLDFFEARGHTIVPSMSLVPGGDQTLLFTNSGMVQFKDVFLGTGKRSYSRVADSQKCMRVAGKHNDLDDVGRDDTHHTFFEMLGNWSFGDYYKKEAIEWAWELLTVEWGLPGDKLWATCFEDELSEIPRDDEAADFWLQQPGFNPEHLLFFGREENFWEMADTGPVGPDSEIFMDRGQKYCEMADKPNHVCQVNGDCQRFIELWNLVFIQYNRSSPTEIKPLPAKHVDTGLGLDRVVAVIQDVDSNYRTDLFTPLMDTVQKLADHTKADRETHFTPYRVIADHSRAATFLIADGVVPGNIGRNYVCRMIIRRASRFGSMIGLVEPFLSKVAETVIEHYGDAYPELVRNRQAILQTVTDEERRFHHTIDIGINYLSDIVQATLDSKKKVISGDQAFNLYATYGLPFEITRDIARESNLDVEEEGFRKAMETHRIASSAGDTLGELADDGVEFYQQLLADLKEEGRLTKIGVKYDPYSSFSAQGDVLAIIKSGQTVRSASPGEAVGVILPNTPFYIEAGGQVSDTGVLKSTNGDDWEMRVTDTRQPVDGLIIHFGEVVTGKIKVGASAKAHLDEQQRLDIMRNHTATHLLHAALRHVLGAHVRQAGSLVASDRLRFDFTHPKAMTAEDIERVDDWVNEAILENHSLTIRHQPQEEAIEEGAMALFGETYGDTVRSVSIGMDNRISFELCAGTHVTETGIIGPFLIVSEGSVAAGIRRIEAFTGREALRMIRSQRASLQRLAGELGGTPDAVEQHVEHLIEERDLLFSKILAVRKQSALAALDQLTPEDVSGISLLTGQIPEADPEILRDLADRFRANQPNSVVVLASVSDEKPLIVAAISPDLVKRNFHAGELVKTIAKIIGGGGGGKPSLAQAGGKDPARVEEALGAVKLWLQERLSSR